MRKLPWTTLLLTFTVVGVLAQEVGIDARPERTKDQEHTQWIQHVMRSIATIKPGMTRKDLRRVLAEDGVSLSGHKADTFTGIAHTSRSMFSFLRSTKK